MVERVSRRRATAARRTEIIGDTVLYLGDCMEIMPLLGKVDAVVTDPPFNAGKDFENDALPEWEWHSFCVSVARAFKDCGATNYLVEVGKSDSVMRASLDAVLPYRWAIVLNYTNAMRNGACGYSNFGLVYWYGGKCYRRYMDRIDAPLESTIDQFSHPSPKELRHYGQLIEMFSLDQGIVLDPFMGSGTTGVACLRLGRKFIGIEIHEPYFDIACRRIEKQYRCGDLLQMSQPKSKQTELIGRK